MARRSRATDRFRREINALYPNRPRASDGWIGDTAHRNRVSDHNPNSAGVVQAEDVTLTIDQGTAVFNRLRAMRDPRVKYVIYRRQIFTSYSARGYPAWAVRPYTGANAHLTHVHLSVQNDPARYDDGSTWRFANLTSIPTEDNRMEELVTAIQQALVDAGHNLGKWGPKGNGVDGAYGNDTHKALVAAFKSSPTGMTRSQGDVRYVRKNVNVKIN